MVMVSVALSGHINMMTLAGVVSGIMRIQTSGDICVGRFTSEVFLISNEHREVIPAGFLAYRAETHNGRFVKGCKVWLCYKIDHLLLGRLETWWWNILLPWFHPD